MPFKTKKRKVAAGKHRIEFNPGGSISYRHGVTKHTDDNSSKSEKNDETFVPVAKNVRMELYKILLLAGLIIGLQIALKLVNLPFLK